MSYLKEFLPVYPGNKTIWILKDPPVFPADPVKRSSTYSLPDEPYTFVICGHKIHDLRMCERYRIYGIGK